MSVPENFDEFAPRLDTTGSRTRSGTPGRKNAVPPPPGSTSLSVSGSGGSQRAVSPGRGRIALAALLLMTFLMYAAQGVMPTILPEVQRDFGVSMGGVSFLLSVFALMRMVAGGMGGYLLPRLGARIPGLLGVSGVVAGALVAGTARRFEVMVMGRGIMGAGFGLNVVASLAFLTSHWPSSRHGRILTLYELGVASSMGVWALAAVPVMEAGGWRAVLVGVAAASGLAGLAALGAFRHPEGQPLVRRSPADPLRSPASRRTRLGFLTVTFALATCLALFVTGFFQTLFPLYGATVLGASAWEVGAAISSGFVANALTLLPLGWLCDRYSRPLLLAGGFGLWAAVLVAFLGPAGPVAYRVGALAIGLGMSVWSIPAMILAEATPVVRRGVFLGWYRVAVDGGVVLGPVLLTMFAERFGFRAAIAGLAGLMLAAALAAVRVSVWLSHRPPAGAGETP